MSDSKIRSWVTWRLEARITVLARARRNLTGRQAGGRAGRQISSLTRNIFLVRDDYLHLFPGLWTGTFYPL
jgi:hypothetical protein